MAVSNGQPGNETTFNNAFVSKTADSSVAAEIQLADADVASGSTVTNVQKELNSISSFAGKALNTAKDDSPVWVNNDFGATTDSLLDRAEALTDEAGEARSDITTAQADILLRELLSNKGIANGYASLDGTGKIPAAQLTASAFEYLGNWNATTNSPTLIDGTGSAGDTYRVSVAGTQDLGSGSVAYVIGDKVVYNATTTFWEKWDVSDEVTSVNGLSGVVVLNLNDINDVTTTGVATGDILRKSAGDWLDFNPDQIANDAATGASATLSSVVDQAVIRLTGGALTSVDMIPATTNAQRFVLVNDTGVQIVINNETGGTAANRILTGTGANLNLSNQACLFMVYDTTDSRWRVVGGSGSGGGATTALDNLAAVAINSSLVPDTDITINLGSAALRWLTMYAQSANDGSDIVSVDFVSRTLSDNTGTTLVNFTAALSLEVSGDVVPDVTATRNIGGATLEYNLVYAQGVNSAGSLSLGADNGNVQILADDTYAVELKNGDNASSSKLRFYDANNSNYAEVKAPSTVSANYSLTLPPDDGNSGEFLRTDGSGVLTWVAAGGTGDVVGPASATDNAIARFDTTTGKLIQNSLATISDTGTLGVAGQAAGTAALSLRSTDNGDNTSGLNLYSADGLSRWNLFASNSDFLFIRNPDLAFFSAVIDNAGKTSFGQAGSSGAFVEVARSADTVQLGVHAHTTQTTDLVQFKNTASATTSKIDGSTNFYMNRAMAGTTSAFTNASAGIELQSTTLALLLSRMNTAAEAALTAVNGMAIYNSQTNKVRVYENGSWVDAVGANTTLSNLGTTSINAHLLPSAAALRNLGSSTLPFNDVFGSQAYVGAASPFLNFQNAAFTLNYGRARYPITSPQGVTNLFAVQGMADSEGLGLLTENNATADANSTDAIYIETGNKTAGTGGSGSITHQSGTSAGGGSGSVLIRTGDSDLDSGPINLTTGASTSGNSGNINLSSHNFLGNFANNMALDVAGNATIASSGGNVTLDASSNVNLTGQTVNMSSISTATFIVPKTITAGGTTGNQTIDKISGTVNFAAAATTLTVTNSTVSTTSLVFATIRTNDATATIKNVVPAAGSFVITLNAAATAETSVGFFVLN